MSHNAEFNIETVKTYATKENVRKAVLKSGDEGIWHTIIKNEEGRYFPVFFPKEEEISGTGIHFRWNIIRR